MKLGFYDSGLGGISVLKEFVYKYGSQFSYTYFGDSKRAPYGDRDPEELKQFVQEIAGYMHEEDVDVLISACNTSSMYLHEIDLDDYMFQVISLFDVMKMFFTNNLDKYKAKQIALLATTTTVGSRRYQDWGVDIYPIKCPSLVPLVEAGEIDAAKLEWQNYLQQVPEGVEDLIVGCTHYAFLVDDDSYNYIDPAKVLVEQFEDSIFADGILNYGPKAKKIEMKIHFTKDSDSYKDIASKLLALDAKV